MGVFILDDKIKDFGAAMEEDDLSNLDLMPPPLFSKVTLPQIYKYPFSPKNTGR